MGFDRKLQKDTCDGQLHVHVTRDNTRTDHLQISASKSLSAFNMRFLAPCPQMGRVSGGMRAAASQRLGQSNQIRDARCQSFFQNLMGSLGSRCKSLLASMFHVLPCGGI